MAELETVVDQTVRIAAPPEVIFEYFVDPQKLVLWIGSRADLEASPGGRFWVDMNGTDVAAGQFIEIEPPTRVVFTWGWEKGGPPMAPGSSTVEVTLTPDGTDTVVRLIHRDIPNPFIESHGAGWSEHFATLVSLAAEGRLVGGSADADL
jgi:uncharacterized protein YndB with AHSA1/START domain